MDREKVKLLIELSSTVEEADCVVTNAGFTSVGEKIAFLKGMFDFKLVGRYDEPDISSEAVIEMDYYAILSTIICCKWER